MKFRFSSSYGQKNAKITLSVSLKAVSVNYVRFCFWSYLMQKPFASLSNTRFPPFSLLCRVASYSPGYASSCSPMCTRELSVTIWVCTKEWEKTVTFWVLLSTLFVALKVGSCRTCGRWGNFRAPHPARGKSIQVIWWRNSEDWDEKFQRRIPQPRAALFSNSTWQRWG